MKLSDPQLKALRLAEKSGLHRWPGGFWSSEEWEAGGRWTNEGPEGEATNIKTIRSLERRGLLERDPARAELPDWCRPRVLTEMGRNLLKMLGKKTVGAPGSRE